MWFTKAVSFYTGFLSLDQSEDIRDAMYNHEFISLDITICGIDLNKKNNKRTGHHCYKP